MKKRYQDLYELTEVDDLVREAYSFIDDYCDVYIKPQATCTGVGAGCSHCCKNSIIAVSALEFTYLVNHSAVAQKQVKKVIPTIREAILPDLINGSMKTKKLGDCPFLVNNRCAIYEYRPIACRTFFSVDKLSLCAKGKKHKLFNSGSNNALKGINDYFQQLSIDNAPDRAVLEIRDIFRR